FAQRLLAGAARDTAKAVPLSNSFFLCLTFPDLAQVQGELSPSPKWSVPLSLHRLAPAGVARRGRSGAACGLAGLARASLPRPAGGSPATSLTQARHLDCAVQDAR